MTLLLEALVKDASHGVGDRRPLGPRQLDALKGIGQARVSRAHPEMFDDGHGVVPPAGDRHHHMMRVDRVRAPESNGGLLLLHCSTSLAFTVRPHSLTSSLRSCPVASSTARTVTRTSAISLPKA